MSDDISLFHPRMRKPAVIAVVFGLVLGFLAIGSQRFSEGAPDPWFLAVPYGLLAAAFLYGIMYRNLSRRLAHEQEGADDG